MITTAKWYSGTLGAQSFQHLSYRWGKTPKKLTQETCPDQGSNPGPLRDKRACSLPPAPQRWTKLLYMSWKFYRKILNVLLQNLLRMEHFEIFILKLVHRCGASGSMRACHAAAPGSIPGRDRFPGWGFFGVFPHLSDKCQVTLGPQGPRISFGLRNHHSIFALLGWLSVWLVCIVFHVSAVSVVAPALGWSLIREGPPCPCVVKKVSMWSIV